MDHNIQRLVDLEMFGIKESDLADIGPVPLKWFTPGEDPAVTMLRIMRDPLHFRFTCQHLLNIKLPPYQVVLLQEMWKHPFPMLLGSRGAAKSFLLALYSTLRSTFMPGTKVVVTGMGFRQAKQILGYAFKFWNDAPVFQSLFAGMDGSGPHPGNDKIWLQLGESTITGIPMGDGNSIRGLRANIVIADEFASIAREIFETVVVGFGAVALNPVEQIERQAWIRVMKNLRAWTEEMAERERLSGMDNQLIISGTCYYQFNHLYLYWKRWKTIIESKGDLELIRKAFGNEEVPEGLDHRDYAIFRIPMELLPPGYLSKKQIDRSKITMHSSTFMQEFCACFASDSNGFFKRQLVESCCTSRPVVPFESKDPVMFQAALRGDPACKYVYGIDPASENDNFSIVVLEVHETHRRVVYCWTTTRQDVKERMGSTEGGESVFYNYVGSKIRELMRVFPCELIALDKQGGGVSVIETLGDRSKLKDDEPPILPIRPGHPLHDGKPSVEDDWPGVHMVELVNFADAAYTAGANHGLRKDLEDKAVLFPYCDPTILAVACLADQAAGRTYDTQEDVVREIEELKDELGTIVHTQTPGTLRDKWDTPEVKLSGSRKGRMRKDRYSSLLMANYAARRLTRTVEPPPMMPFGGFVVHNKADQYGDQPILHGPDDWTRGVEDNFEDYGCV